jgi:hypothetical protein
VTKERSILKGTLLLLAVIAAGFASFMMWVGPCCIRPREFVVPQDARAWSNAALEFLGWFAVVFIPIGFGGVLHYASKKLFKAKP